MEEDFILNVSFDICSLEGEQPSEYVTHINVHVKTFDDDMDETIIAHIELFSFKVGVSWFALDDYTASIGNFAWAILNKNSQLKTLFYNRMGQNDIYEPIESIVYLDFINFKTESAEIMFPTILKLLVKKINIFYTNNTLFFSPKGMTTEKTFSELGFTKYKDYRYTHL